MPAPTDILRGLSSIANDLVPIAIGWHALLVAVVIALLRGWRPSLRARSALLVAPALSVAVVAIAYGNPFNGASFLVLSVGLVAVAGRPLPTFPTAVPRWATVIGLLMLGLGWCYPHFLAGGATRYLYAAPLGLVPCPTLALLAGVTLLAGGFGARPIPALLAVWTIGYAIFGCFVLGVRLDALLLVGGAGLAALAVGRRSISARTPRSAPRHAAAALDDHAAAR